MKPWTSVEITRQPKFYIDESRFDLNSFETIMVIDGEKWMVMGSRTKKGTAYVREHLLQKIDDEYKTKIVAVNNYKPKELNYD